MENIIFWVLAVCAILGGLDELTGNHFGLGEKFRDGFMALGPTALSMAGILCLAPIMGKALGRWIAPLWMKLALDPALLGGLLAIDMGGYQLSVELAVSPCVGLFAGIIVASTFGCTLSFTLPIGVQIVPRQDQPAFLRGILLGLIGMPLALIVGGLMCGLALHDILWQSLPVVLLSLLIGLGLKRWTRQTMKGFRILAACIRALSLLGLVLAAAQYISRITILPDMLPLEEAMAVVSSIGMMLLGSLPAAELLQRMMKKPFVWLGRRLNMNSASITGLLVSVVSVLPAISMLKEMDERGKLVNAAGMVCSASLFAAHLGFTAGVAPSMVTALIAAKLAGSLAGVLLALLTTRKSLDETTKERNDASVQIVEGQ